MAEGRKRAHDQRVYGGHHRHGQPGQLAGLPSALAGRTGDRRQDVRAQITLPGVERMIELKHLSEVLPCADAVILCLPANSETQGFFTHREFALMKQDAVFVNVGRGSLVNDRDILQALDEGQIGGAILDVTQEEPLPADDPLWDHEQVIITPHAAGTFANDACWKQFGEIVVENLRRFHEGKAAHQ